jgi:hypothetical protein
VATEHTWGLENQGAREKQTTYFLTAKLPHYNAQGHVRFSLSYETHSLRSSAVLQQEVIRWEELQKLFAGSTTLPISIKNHYKNTEKRAWTLKKDGYCTECVVQFYPQIRVTSGTMLESRMKSAPNTFSWGHGTVWYYSLHAASVFISSKCKSERQAVFIIIAFPIAGV